MMSDAESYPIRSWTLCYYVDKSRTWVYGDLSVHMNGVSFQSSVDTKPPLKFKLIFNDFTGVKKTTTGLIFSALVIILSNGCKHWFSSIPDRESLYNCVHYFWKCSLLTSKKPDKSQVGFANRTEKGRQLLSIVHDTDKTLRGAAESLSIQGAQIDSAMGTMLDIHNDLDVADGLMSGLESWFGKWKMPKEYNYVEPVFVSKDDISEVLEYEILYTKLQVGKASMQNVGLLRVSKEGLFILTEKQKVVHKFKWSDISLVKVVTLWEIVVTRFLIGEPDLSYSIISSGLRSLLKLLDRRLRSRLEYTSNIVDQVTSKREYTVSSREIKSEREQLHGRQETYPYKNGTKFTGNSNLSSGSSSGSGSQIQAIRTKEIVSEEEVQELSQVLGDLKNIALAVGQETDVQNEKLDKLTSSVNRANDRLEQTDHRIKRLL